jgi:hypothetical protein
MTRSAALRASTKGQGYELESRAISQVLERAAAPGARPPCPHRR